MCRPEGLCGDMAALGTPSRFAPSKCRAGGSWRGTLWRSSGSRENSGSARTGARRTGVINGRLRALGRRGGGAPSFWEAPGPARAKGAALQLPRSLPSYRGPPVSSAGSAGRVHIHARLQPRGRLLPVPVDVELGDARLVGKDGAVQPARKGGGAEPIKPAAASRPSSELWSATSVASAVAARPIHARRALPPRLRPGALRRVLPARGPHLSMRGTSGGLSRSSSSRYSLFT
jgi:hypothetical protein